MDKNILIITGEPSGDIHAGELLKELKPLVSGVSFWGIGGDTLSGAGMELIEHVKNLSLVGVVEIIKHLPKIHAQYKDVVLNVRKRKPSLAILVDYPGFNLRIAAFLKKEGVPVIYYIIPQVWAWGQGRTKLIKKFVNKALVLFDFEKKFLEEYGINAAFVGHPLLDKFPENVQDKPKMSELKIALLPGSRKNEVTKILPEILGAARMIKDRYKNIRFFLAKNSNVNPELYASFLKSYSDLDIEGVTDNVSSALEKSDFAIVASGTATLETAVMEKPMVIVYKMSHITYLLAKHVFSKVDFAGLVNIIAKKEIVPELLQDNCSPEKIAKRVINILDNAFRLEKMKNDLRMVKRSLGKKGASARAAKAVGEFYSSL